MKKKKKQRSPLPIDNCRNLVMAWAPLVGANDSPTVLGVLIAATLRGGIQ